jgi:hypothetical protein
VNCVFIFLFYLTYNLNILLKLIIYQYNHRPKLLLIFVLCKVIEQLGVGKCYGLFILKASFSFYLTGCLFLSGNGLYLYYGKGVKNP